jgi:hypothetical protein
MLNPYSHPGTILLLELSDTDMGASDIPGGLPGGLGQFLQPLHVGHEASGS